MRVSIDQIIEAIAGAPQDVDVAKAQDLTNIANAISNQASANKLRYRARWLTDNTGSIATVVNVQLGRRKSFPDSEDISVRVFGVDNIKVILTHNVVAMLKMSGEDVEQLSSFTDQDSTLQFLEFVYSRVIAADSNSGSNL